VLIEIPALSLQCGRELAGDDGVSETFRGVEQIPGPHDRFIGGNCSGGGDNDARSGNSG
jgi:hypothetical protein